MRHRNGGTEACRKRLASPAVTPIVDAHLDLAYLASRGVDLCRPSPDPGTIGVTLPALRQGGVRLVFATIFTESVDPGIDRALDAWEYAGASDLRGAATAGERQLGLYALLERTGTVRIVRSRRDLEPLEDDGPLRVVILMEGADPISAPEDAARWFDAGVRVVGLSWARGSRYAGGNAMPGGLTADGRRLLAALESLGAVLDCSHLSDQAFDEALDSFGGPIVATHSNARALLEPSERHLRDDQARRIAERDGIVGLNLYGKFLASGRAATADDALAHLEHWRALIGASHVGLGSDFDGGFGPRDCPEGLRRPEDLPHLLERLGSAGWSAGEVRDFACESWLRLLRRALPA